MNPSRRCLVTGLRDYMSYKLVHGCGELSSAATRVGTANPQLFNATLSAGSRWLVSSESRIGLQNTCNSYRNYSSIYLNYDPEASERSSNKGYKSSIDSHHRSRAHQFASSSCFGLRTPHRSSRSRPENRRRTLHRVVGNTLHSEFVGSDIRAVNSALQSPKGSVTSPLEAVSSGLPSTIWGGVPNFSTIASQSQNSVAAIERHVAACSSSSQAKVLDGRAMASEWLEETRREVEDLMQNHSCAPTFSVVLVGERPDSVIYVERKQEAATSIGIKFSCQQLPGDSTQSEVEEAVRRACNDDSVHGVLVQLPLPPHIDEAAVLDSLDPRKDVDGCHPYNMGKTMMRGHTSQFVPCTPLGCIKLLEKSNVKIEGAHCVVLGDSNIVGLPLAALLRDKGAAEVTMCHQMGLRVKENLADLTAITRSADILIAAVGVPSLVKQHWVQQGAVVLDVGINRINSTESSSATDSATSAAASLDSTRPPSIPQPSTSPITPCRSTTRSSQLPAGTWNTSSTNESPRMQESRSVYTKSADASARTWADRKPEQYNTTNGHQDMGEIRVIGDVDFQEVAQVASVITPVPGGVGPMTIASLMSNIVLAARIASSSTAQ